MARTSKHVAWNVISAIYIAHVLAYDIVAPNGAHRLPFAPLNSDTATSSTQAAGPSPMSPASNPRHLLTT